MSRKIDTDAVIDRIRLKEQGSNPAAPDAGYQYLYAKTTGIFLETSAGAVVGPLITGTALKAPTDAEYITSAIHSDLSAEVAIPGLAGHADIIGIGGAGTAEEYDTATTGLTWTPSDPSTVNSDTTIKSHLYVVSTDTTERLGTKAWSPAGAFDARAKICYGTSSTSRGGIGLHIGNSDNSLRLLLNIASDGSNVIPQGYTYASSTYTSRGFHNFGSNTIYVRITRDGSNNVAFYFSDNGLVWIYLGGLSFTLTVANIGFRSASNAHLAAIDWLRTSV